jgi:hypothetical protein
MENKKPEKIKEDNEKADENPPDNNAPGINDGILTEGFLPPEFIEELVEELPPKPPKPKQAPPKIPEKKEKPEIRDILKRSPVKSESFIVLMDRRRPNVYIDLANARYSEQKLHESMYDHLKPELQKLIETLKKVPFAAVVAEPDWQNPPNFKLQYTVISNNDKSNEFNNVFAQMALYNDEIKFRPLSAELKELPNKLTENLDKYMDIAQIEALYERIKQLIQELLKQDYDSSEYQEALTETEELPRGMGEKIIKLINLIKRADIEHDHEDLCQLELKYPDWNPRQTWNYCVPWKMVKRARYKNLIKEVWMQLEKFI